MPYQPPSAYPSPYQPQPAAKRRPSWVWFLVGGIFMFAGAVLAVVTLAQFGIDVDRDDALFKAKGTHVVNVPEHTRRGIFLVPTEPIPHCTVTHADGTSIDLEPPASRFDTDEWEAELVFDTGDGTLRFRCRGAADSMIRIGVVPERDDYVRVGILGVAVPFALGGIGFLVVLINGILWYIRRPRPAYPAPPPGWQPPPPPPTWPPQT
jgi:hypothetical protein